MFTFYASLLVFVAFAWLTACRVQPLERGPMFAAVVPSQRCLLVSVPSLISRLNAFPTWAIRATGPSTAIAAAVAPAPAPSAFRVIAASSRDGIYGVSGYRRLSFQSTLITMALAPSNRNQCDNTYQKKDFHSSNPHKARVTLGGESAVSETPADNPQKQLGKSPSVVRVSLVEPHLGQTGLPSGHFTRIRQTPSLFVDMT